MGTRHTGRGNARRLWALALAVLLPGLGAAVIGTSAFAAGPVSTVTVAVSPSCIKAVGGSTTATATLKDSTGAGVSGQTVTFASDSGGGTFGPVTDHLDGTYTSTFTATGPVGTYHISATGGGKSSTTSATLTESGAPTAITLVSLSPDKIRANGTSTSTATASLTDAGGRCVGGEAVTFTSSPAAPTGPSVGPTTDHGDGTYSATLLASTMPGTYAITAHDTVASLTSSSQTLTEFGPAATVTLSSKTPTVVADGATKVPETVTVKDSGGRAVTDDTILMTTSGDATFDPVVNNHDGTYSTNIIASKTADTETITAHAETASDTATLTETNGPAATVTLTVNPTSIKADNGVSTSTATATVKDANGNLVKVGNETVKFTTSGDVKFTPITTAANGNGDGTYSSTISSSKTADTETITATTSNGKFGTATLTETAGSANGLALKLNPTTVPADGTSTSTATATVTDSLGNGVPNVTVTFGTSGDTTVSPPSATTDSSGNASTTITASKTADTETITASGGGHSNTAQLVEYGPAKHVVVTVNPTSITADGSKTSTAKAVVTDVNNQPVLNETVVFHTDGDVTFGPVTLQNDGTGTYTSTITASKTADTEHISATATKAGVSSTTSAPLTETPGAPILGLTLSPSTITADGVATSTATASVKDSNGNPYSSETVTIATNGDTTISPSPMTNNHDGTYTATITSSKTADQETITATDNAVNPPTATATLTELAGPAASVALALNPTSLTADGTSTSTATATVKDVNNNPVKNETVTMSTNGDAAVGAVTNHLDGTYTATITASKTADVETITAKANDANKTGTAQLTENPGPPVLNLTLTPSSIPADGKSTSTAKATVKDANGNPYPSETVTIATSGDTTVGSVSNNGGGVYTATIKASTTADSETITATDSAKSLTKTATLTETPTGTGFHATSPTRILDTRDPNGGGALGPNSTRKVQVAGAQGSPVPATHVSAVVLNLTATQPSTQTYLTLFPSNPMPTASNLNVSAGRDAANLVTVQLASDGSVELYNAQGTVHAIFDVVGYFDDATIAGASHYVALNPSRIDDTRTASGGGRLGANSTRKVQVTGVGNVPALHVNAVVVNLTGVQPSSGTYLTLFPSGTPPNASNVNLLPGEIRPNLVMVPVAADGSVMLYNAAGTTDAILDVAGYFDDGTVPTAKGFTPVAPGRILDTRNSQPVGQPGTPNPDQVQVTGVTGGPPAGATAAVINVTATQASTGTYITVFPSNPMPTVSNLNVPPGVDIPNLSVDTLASNGSVQLYNAQGTVHVIFDVAGWFG